MQHDLPSVSRRTFLGAAAAAAATPMMVNSAMAADAKPNSKFNGVQIGVITYSYRSLPGSAEDVLAHVVKSGISSIELMGPTAESYAKQYAGDDASKLIAGYSALKKMYNDAGVNIHIIKFPQIGDGKMTDEQIDVCFEAAKAVGAGAITREISDDAAKRLAPFADKHEIMIGFHNHTQLTPTFYDGDILSHSKHLGINLDIGHYVAGTNCSPIPLIEKFADRIVSLHIKDRKINNGPNMPFGEGDTPVALVLQFLKRNGYTFPADIELEYKFQDSDAVTEVGKCVEFCKASLA